MLPNTEVLWSQSVVKRTTFNLTELFAFFVEGEHDRVFGESIQASTQRVLAHQCQQKNNDEEPQSLTYSVFQQYNDETRLLAPTPRRSLYLHQYGGQYCPYALQNKSFTHASQCPNGQVNIMGSPSMTGGITTTAATADPPPVLPVTGEGCDQCHSELEFAYHFQNYKLDVCPCSAHYRYYPGFLRREMATYMNLHQLQSMLTMGGGSSMDLQNYIQRDNVELLLTDEAAQCLQQCPYYHTLTEKEAWAAWRAAYMGFQPATASKHDVDKYVQQFRSHSFFAQCLPFIEGEAALESSFSSGSASAESQRRALLELNPFSFAFLMQEYSVHSIVCFLSLADAAAIHVLYPSSFNSKDGGGVVRSSAHLVVPRHLSGTMAKLFTAIEPLTHPSPLQISQRLELAQWLLSRAKELTSDLSIPFFPGCSKDPFLSPQPQTYYTYLGYVAMVLQGRSQDASQAGQEGMGAESPSWSTPLNSGAQPSKFLSESPAEKSESGERKASPAVNPYLVASQNNISPKIVQTADGTFTLNTTTSFLTSTAPNNEIVTNMSTATSTAQPPGPPPPHFPPLSFLLDMPPLLLLVVAHEMVQSNWIKRRKIQTEILELWIVQKQKEIYEQRQHGATGSIVRV